MGRGKKRKSIGSSGKKKKSTKTEINSVMGSKKKSRSYFLSCEKKLDVYKRVENDLPNWVPPLSSFTLLQENHSFDPWRVLIICILLNKTKGFQVEGVLEDLFGEFPNAEAVIKVSRKRLEQILKPLGLSKKRAKTIKKFSRQYLRADWTHVTQLHGVGKYAADAYVIFCVGEPEAVIPQDHKLVTYWKYVCEKRNALRTTNNFADEEKKNP